MKLPIITIIGSTGTIGKELVRLLSEAGVPVRAVLRDFHRARSLPGITWIQADISDLSFREVTLAGTDLLLLLTVNQSGFGQIQTDVIYAVIRVGVEHVVKLSALGVSLRTKSPLAHEH